MTFQSVYSDGAAIEKLNSAIAYAIKEIQRTYGDNVVVGRKSLNKFGASFDVDSATDLEDISQIVGVRGSNEVYLAGNTIDTVSSSDAGDTHTISIEGMTLSGGDMTFVKQDVTLNGQTKVTLTTPLARCTRMENNSATATAGTVYTYIDTAIVAGVPSDLTQVYSMLEAANERSLKAATSIASTNYFINTGLYAAIARSSSARSEIRIASRLLGEVFKSNRVIGITQTSPYNADLTPPFIVRPNSDIVMQANSSATNTTVYGGFSGVFADIISGEFVPLVKVTPDAWIDVYTELGIAVGLPLVIQNLGGAEVMLCMKDTVPGDGDGYNLIKGSEKSGMGGYIAAGSPKVWLKAAQFTENVSIQLAV